MLYVIVGLDTHVRIGFPEEIYGYRTVDIENINVYSTGTLNKNSVLN
jgi:hypothetical protein